MMLRKTVKYGTVLAYAVLAVAGLATAADDKKDDKPALKGVWALKDSELKLEFSDKDVLKISPHGKDEVFLVVCKYTLEKEGLVKAKITGLEGKAKDKAKEILPVGLKFSFKWQVADATATLDDVKGDNADHLKAHLEGKYEEKK
ncbi:MAG: hypothetical protein E6K70_12480 [Planctomycetota bacterium]|nr:MAG: hypothetical protein E6K70_12480 [Planctomycetota bacterium]